MILVNASLYEGTPPRLYRSPEEINRDIRDLRGRIESLNGMLNPRNIINEMLSECASGNACDWVSALRAIVDDAEQTLESLNELNESLDGLTKELKETSCIMRL